MASAITGARFEAYMSVDLALITQVLPDAESRAQDLGIMNTGSAIPLAPAPLTASLSITSDRGRSPRWRAR
ncbi:hypothetical protein P1P68_04980 [Streptomyces scabiei]|uniref:hypothetical protein n=1 Tax=Streptomyces scabiei TaxID=1930 RepID=UPI0029905B81|nr:hypothetical protein [Streptomyces scabiei]MDW8804161.1 hypothetical protein [Streptomyces scabiei]